MHKGSLTFLAHFTTQPGLAWGSRGALIAPWSRLALYDSICGEERGSLRVSTEQWGLGIILLSELINLSAHLPRTELGPTP